MNRTLLTILLLLITLGAAFAQSPADEFKQKMMGTETEAQALALIKEYLPRLNTLDDLRTLQNFWMRLDANACREWFEQKHLAMPESPEFHYLHLRNHEDNAVQLSGSRALIEMAPDFYWAYRLFYSTYAQIMVNEAEKIAMTGDLERNRVSDLLLMQDGLRRFPGDDYASLALFHHYNHYKDYARAESYLIQMREIGALEANFNLVLQFVKETKRVRAFEEIFPRMLSAAVSSRKIPAADSSRAYNNYLLFVYQSAGMWDELESWLNANPEYQTSDSTILIRIELAIVRQRYDAAMDLITKALASNSVTLAELLSEERYSPLRQRSQWETFVQTARANEDKAIAQRRVDALAKRISKPSPDWELPDVNGKLVKLSELKGKPLLLYFWATWCTPCRTDMPLIQKWMSTFPMEGINVFAINVWENDPGATNAFMRENRLTMPLLFGNNALMSELGLSGIPYVCAIDKKGNIAFEESGFGDFMSEKLTIWMEELLK
ncbi:MAG: TlpA disulfide reductase family protein [Candidatus Cloacimonadaceae bacterium]|nr:TlpA disulfide reductase family protein [Candidatus Cloacimonadaceae bacterium]